MRVRPSYHYFSTDQVSVPEKPRWLFLLRSFMLRLQGYTPVDKFSEDDRTKYPTAAERRRS